jgi:oxygen-dependent protoporphyrinogen oxidase
MRVFIGGACQCGLLRLSGEQLIQLAECELKDMLGIDGPPLLRNLAMQKHAMPQYHVGHGERVASIEHQLEAYPTLALAGSALHGVGVPSCIESGENAAKRVATALRAAPLPAVGQLNGAEPAHASVL